MIYGTCIVPWGSGCSECLNLLALSSIWCCIALCLLGCRVCHVTIVSYDNCIMWQMCHVTVLSCGMWQCRGPAPVPQYFTRYTLCIIITYREQSQGIFPRWGPKFNRFKRASFQGGSPILGFNCKYSKIIWLTSDSISKSCSSALPNL